MFSFFPFDQILGYKFWLLREDLVPLYKHIGVTRLNIDSLGDHWQKR